MDTRRGARGLFHRGRSCRSPEDPLELAQEATVNCGRLQQRFEKMAEKCQRVRSRQQHIDCLLEEIRSDCENIEKSKERLQQCIGIPEPGALRLCQKNIKQQKEASAQAEKAEQKDRMEASERERHRAEMQETLEQWEKEKAKREQEHQKVLFKMRQKVATLQAQKEEERTRFENARREVLLEEQNERSALSEALLQTRGELSRACQQVQQLRQELKEQQEKEQTIKAELQAELQEARSEIQAAQRRHKEGLQGVREEMKLLLEQREALQKQVGELTSQLAASRESQEAIIQRAQKDVSEAQEQSRQKLLEVEHIQRMLEEAENKNKKLQMYLQNLGRAWSQWEEVAQQNSELQASVNVLEREKARLILSLEKKNLCLRTLEEKNLALNNQVSQFHFAVQQAEQLHFKHRRELQELNTQTWALLEAVMEKAARQETQEKQLETEVSELRVRLQSSEERAEAMATQCRAVELELRKMEAQRDQLKACNQELQKKLEESEQDWWKEQLKHASREIALQKEATERQEEAEILHQEVASLQRKLESLEKERKDVLHERELYQQQMRDLEKKNEMHAAEMTNHRENNQQLEVEREGMQEELEHGTAALKKWVDSAQVLRAALNKSEMSKGSLKKHLDILKGKTYVQPAFKAQVKQLFCMSDASLESEQLVASSEKEKREWPEWSTGPRTGEQQAAGAEGKQLSEHSRKTKECVWDVVATSAKVKTEKRELRRTYEVEPEGRGIRTFRRVFPKSAQQNMSTSGRKESSSSSEEQQPSC